MSELHYESKKTIHGKTSLDIEVDKDGKVVSVWYNCLALPFSQSEASPSRASEMDQLYKSRSVSPIIAVSVETKEA